MEEHTVVNRQGQLCMWSVQTWTDDNQKVHLQSFTNMELRV